MCQLLSTSTGTLLFKVFTLNAARERLFGRDQAGWSVKK